MAEVTKEGEGLNWKRETECSSCGTEYSIKVEDLYLEAKGFLGLGTGSYHTDCPKCGTPNYFTWSVPPHISKQATKRKRVKRV